MDYLVFNTVNFNQSGISQGRIRLALNSTVGDLKEVIGEVYDIDPFYLSVTDGHVTEFFNQVPMMEVLTHCDQRIPYVVKLSEDQLVTSDTERPKQSDTFSLRFILEMNNGVVTENEIVLPVTSKVSDLKEYFRKQRPGKFMDVMLDGQVLNRNQVLSRITRYGELKLHVKDLSDEEVYVNFRTRKPPDYRLSFYISTDATVGEIINHIRNIYDYGPIRLIVKGKTLQNDDILWDKMIEQDDRSPVIVNA